MSVQPSEPAAQFVAFANCCENPDCVNARAIEVAAPRISRMAPDSDAVSTNIGTMRDQPTAGTATGR
jgi:hypothetical protein